MRRQLRYLNIILTVVAALLALHLFKGDPQAANAQEITKVDIARVSAHKGDLLSVRLGSIERTQFSHRDKSIGWTGVALPWEPMPVVQIPETGGWQGKKGYEQWLRKIIADVK